MKTNTFFNIAVAGILVLFLNSCASEYYFTVDVLKPAEISLPANIKKIIVINHSYIPGYCSISDINGDTKAGFDSIFSFQHINAFTDYLKYSPRFEVKNVYSVSKPKAKRFDYINLKTVDELCKKEGADAAVILEGCYFAKTMKTNSQDERYASSAGSEKSDTATVRTQVKRRNSEYTKYNLVVENLSFWRFYNSKEQKIIDEQVIRDSSNILAKGTDAEMAFRFSPSVFKVLEESANRTGNEYAHRVAQQWVAEQRMLYTSGVNGFSDALAFAKNSNWAKAIELWKACINSKNTEVASKAAYNIAVAYELNDNLGSALNWASKSYLLQKSLGTDNYIRLLEKRLKEQRQVKEQISQVKSEI